MKKPPEGPPSMSAWEYAPLPLPAGKTRYLCLTPARWTARVTLDGQRAPDITAEEFIVLGGVCPDEWAYEVEGYGYRFFTLAEALEASASAHQHETKLRQ